MIFYLFYGVACAAAGALINSRLSKKRERILKRKSELPAVIRMPTSLVMGFADKIRGKAKKEEPEQ